MEQNERFIIDNVLNDLSDGVIVIGFDGRIILHNRAAEQILGMEEGSLNDKSVARIMAETDENDEFFELILDAVYTKSRAERMMPFTRGDEMLYLRVTTDFLMNGAEKVGVILHFNDITESTMLFFENKRLTRQVIDLMNSFVEVMVTAVEEKSSYNANHTKNMVKYAVRYLGWLAERGELTAHTTENTAPLIMSVWLHDIGKLLVPQEIMDKPTRLGSALKDIRHRIETARLMLQIDALSGKCPAEEAEAQIRQLDEAQALILSANAEGFQEPETAEKLRAAAAIRCTAADGTVSPLLSDRELEAITVRKGTLTADERKIIEAHVSLTGKLLSKMDFQGDFAEVPRWAAGHHETLDGSGYPQHLTAAEIPWETRLISVIDVYDALTADDRPYKPPMPPERAFAILRGMADSCKLDREIVESFYESGAWKRADGASAAESQK